MEGPGGIAVRLLQKPEISFFLLQRIGDAGKVCFYKSFVSSRSISAAVHHEIGILAQRTVAQVPGDQSDFLIQSNLPVSRCSGHGDTFHIRRAVFRYRQEDSKKHTRSKHCENDIQQNLKKLFHVLYLLLGQETGKCRSLFCVGGLMRPCSLQVSSIPGRRSR